MSGRDGLAWRQVRLAAVSAALALLAACSSGSDGGDDAERDKREASTTTTTAPPAYEPVYEEVDCATDRFEGRVPAERATCGTLTVPEDRQHPDERSVVLPVVVLDPGRPDDPPAADPVVFLSGGPGDSAIDGAEGFADRAFGGDRPLVLVDQRGTGRATPNLNCPQIEAVIWENAAATDDIAVELEREERAARSCRSDLAAVADLDQYDTPTMAADMADLREAMGIDEWNVWGLSYGTAIALEVMRSHPEGVRSVVLDSVVPPDRPSGNEANVERATAALERLFDACASDDACDAARPDLREDLLTVADRLDREPYEVHFTDQEGIDRVAHLTGQDILSGTFQALYDSSLIPLLPGFVGELLDGKYGVLDAVGGDLLGSLADSSEGLGAIVECADQQDHATFTDSDELRADHPLAAAQAGDDVCGIWDVESVEAGFRTTGRTDLPTLVLGNLLDPTTPAADSERVASELGPKATYAEFPGLGHGALFQQQTLCPVEISQAFLDDPTAKVDLSCIDEIEPVKWAV